MLIYGLLGVIAMLAGVYFVRRWELAVQFVMVLLVYEGALRKWILPSLQAEIYVLKDVVMLVAIVGFFLAKRAVESQKSYSGTKFFMWASALYFFVLIFNPNSPSILLSILGFKNYVLYFPLPFMVAAMFQSREQMFEMFRKYLWIVLPAILICYIQFALPPTHWLNAYVEQQEGVDSFTSQFGNLGLARTAGTFSFLSGNTTFLTAMFLLSFSYIVGQRFKFNGNRLYYFVMIACIGAIFTTGSRSGVLSFWVGAIPILLVAAARQHISQSALVRMLIGSVLVFGIVTAFAGDQIDAFEYRAETAGDADTRLTAPFEETLAAWDSPSPIGTGLASTHGGLATIVLGSDQGYYWLDGVMVEVESAKVMLETGVVGFFLNYGMRIVILIAGIGAAFRLRSPSFSALAAGLSVWFAIHLYLFIVNNPTAALYYYFGFGLIMAMRKIEQLELAQYVGSQRFVPSMAQEPGSVRPQPQL